MGILSKVFETVTLGAFKQPKSKPFAVQSPTEAAFGGGFEELLLGRETDEEGGFLGPSLLGEAFDPKGRDRPFKKAKKKIKKTFALEQEAGLRTLIEDILPAIRESAGARGTGVSTGTQVAGVRAGEAFLEDIGTRESAALANIDFIRAKAQDALFNQIINAALQQSGTTGVGTPEFGTSFFQEAVGAAGVAVAAKEADLF